MQYTGVNRRKPTEHIFTSMIQFDDYELTVEEEDLGDWVREIEGDALYESIKRQFGRYTKGIISEVVKPNDRVKEEYPTFTLTTEMSKALNVEQANKDIEYVFNMSDIAEVYAKYQKTESKLEEIFTILKEYSTRKVLYCLGEGDGKWKVQVKN